MASSNFWRERAADFQLVPDYGMLRADGQYTVGTGAAWTWRLSGGANEFIRSTFEALARRAAFELAGAATTELLVAWLEAIRKEHINFRSSQIATEVREDGSKGPQYVLGTIEQVCTASVILCRKLESDALQAEFGEKQRDEPRNWNATRQDVAAFKELRKLITGPHETIPEALVRNSLARQFNIKPEEVTWSQIRTAVAGLLRDYPAITLVPTETAPSQPVSENASNGERPEVDRRAALLAEYKTATKNPPNKRIYEARNPGIHKPEFYEWVNGTLPTESATAISFERFLREKKPPVPRKPKG